MADNVEISKGVGTLIASDQIGSVQHQRVKIEHGSDGEAIDASATNPLPVDARGSLAHDAIDSGNPVKIGMRARTELAAAVANNDRADAMGDKYGRQLIAPAPLDQVVTGKVNLTTTTAADVLGTPGSGKAIVVTHLLVTNAAATSTKVELLDGATSKLIGYAVKEGGGFTLSDPSGLVVASSNTAVRAKCATGGADVDVFVSGYKIPA